MKGRGYLFYAIIQGLFRLNGKNYSGNTKTGATHSFQSKAFKIEIPLISSRIEIQEQIVDTLSAYDDLIENNQKQIKLLEEAAQRLYKEWFVDLRFPGYEDVQIVDGVPEGWKKKVLMM